MIRMVTFLILFCSSFMLYAADETPSANELSARETVNSYLGALMTGDTQQASTLLAPRLVKQRQSLFDNPTYSTQLQQAYANASYEIVKSKALNKKKVQVDVKVMLNPQDSVHSRFVLKRINQSFLIVSEQ